MDVGRSTTTPLGKQQSTPSASGHPPNSASSTEAIDGDSSFFSPTGALPNSCASTEVASKTVESARAQGVVPPKLFITSFSECGAIKDGSSPPGGIRSPPSWSRAPRCEPQGGLPPPAKVTSAFISAGSTQSATRRFFERATKIHTPSTKPPPQGTNGESSMSGVGPLPNASTPHPHRHPLFAQGELRGNANLNRASIEPWLLLSGFDATYAPPTTPRCWPRRREKVPCTRWWCSRPRRGASTALAPTSSRCCAGAPNRFGLS